MSCKEVITINNGEPLKAGRVSNFDFAVVVDFEKELEVLRERIDKAFKDYPLDEDEDLLGIECDNLRNFHLTNALKLANTEAECKKVNGYALERNVNVRELASQKILFFQNLSEILVLKNGNWELDNEAWKKIIDIDKNDK